MAGAAAPARPQGSELAHINAGRMVGSPTSRQRTPSPAAAPHPPIEGDLILRPDPGEQLLLVAAGLLSGFGAYAMIRDDNLSGWAGAAFALFLVSVASYNLMPGGAQLRLTVDGFEARSVDRNLSRRWGDVAGFYVVNVSSRWKRERVGWHWGTLAAEWLPSNYGLEAAELAALMNTRRRRAVEKAIA